MRLLYCSTYCTSPKSDSRISIFGTMSVAVVPAGSLACQKDSYLKELKTVVVRCTEVVVEVAKGKKEKKKKKKKGKRNDGVPSTPSS